MSVADYADRRCRTGWIAPFWQTQGAPKKAPIHFCRFHKLGEAFAAERAVEVVGQLHGEKEASTFRLEAMRAGSGAGYEVAVYRQQKVLAVAPARNSGGARPEPVKATVWAQYDLIRSETPTAERALEQVAKMGTGSLLHSACPHFCLG